MEDSGSGHYGGHRHSGSRHDLKSRRTVDLDVALEDVIAKNKHRGKDYRNQDRDRETVKKPISKGNYQSQNRRPEYSNNNFNRHRQAPTTNSRVVLKEVIWNLSDLEKER